MAWSGAKTNIKSISTPVSAVSSQSIRSLRKCRNLLMGSRIHRSLLHLRGADVKKIGPWPKLLGNW